MKHHTASEDDVGLVRVARFVRPLISLHATGDAVGDGGDAAGGGSGGDSGIGEGGGSGGDTGVGKGGGEGEGDGCGLEGPPGANDGGTSGVAGGGAHDGTTSWQLTGHERTSSAASAGL